MKTGNNVRCRRLFRRIFQSLSVVVFVMLLPLTSSSYEILLGTGGSGSFSHFAGKTLCRLISANPDLSCKAIPASDNTHNLTNLRSGSLDIALVDSRMFYDALNGKGYFKYLDIAYDNLNPLAALYNIPVVLVARDDAKILTLDDLKGKRINMGVPLSRQYLAAESIMQAKGWTEKDFSLVQNLSASHAQDTLAFSGGTIEAMFHIGVHPDRNLDQLLKRTRARLVSMDDSDIEKMVQGDNALTSVTIPAGSYSTNPEIVKTFGSRMLLVTTIDLDDGTVRSIEDAVFHHGETLKKVHPSFVPVKE
ncbi:MAG: TAXI family TRAP transporter solute-binding subunit [Deltaproteobacteria bacterium]|nr:TAXI family TRAP transporter solute-binding subunit [Deltaproteobacteria bacterium]